MIESRLATIRSRIRRIHLDPQLSAVHFDGLAEGRSCWAM